MTASSDPAPPPSITTTRPAQPATQPAVTPGLALNTRAAVAPLPRRMLAEAAGTTLLVAIVIGSGIMAERLSTADVGLQLLENSTATALGLTVLITWLAPVSGAHLNPAVSLADRLLGRRDRCGLIVGGLTAYISAQLAGGIGGAVLANLMFALPAISLSQHQRSEGHLWLGQTVATAGLVAVIFALTRTGRTALAAPTIGAYIGAAYWFTSSTSFANPAVTAGRALSDTFAGIAPAAVPGFLAAQLAGLALGLALTVGLYPTRRTSPSRPGKTTPP